MYFNDKLWVAIVCGLCFFLLGSGFVLLFFHERLSIGKQASMHSLTKTLDGKIYDSLIEQGVVQEVANDCESVELLATALNFKDESIIGRKKFQHRYTESRVIVAKTKYYY